MVCLPPSHPANHCVLVMYVCLTFPHVGGNMLAGYALDMYAEEKTKKRNVKNVRV